MMSGIFLKLLFVIFCMVKNGLLLRNAHPSAKGCPLQRVTYQFAR